MTDEQRAVYRCSECTALFAGPPTLVSVIWWVDVQTVDGIRYVQQESIGHLCPSCVTRLDSR